MPPLRGCHTVFLYSSPCICYWSPSGTKDRILFNVGTLLCSVMLFSWEIYCNKAVSSVFKPYVIEEIQLQLLPNSFECDIFIYTQYAQIHTLLFLRKKNLLLTVLASCKTMYFYLKFSKQTTTQGKCQEVLSSSFSIEGHEPTNRT